MEHTRCLIIGSGPAGFTAGIYTGRADIKPILFEGEQPGGQLTITTEIENFPGYPEGVAGTAMMDDLRRQAQRFGCDVRTGYIKQIDLQKRPFHAVDDHGNEFEAETVIIATGASAKWIGLESERQFYGAGVSACATCDGYFYRNRVVAVVGGGDTACEEASYLAGLCSKVYMIVRRDVFRASEASAKRVLENPKIEVLWKCNTKEVLGDENGVTGVRLVRADGSEFEVALDGFFLAIGHHPNSDLFKQWVATDAEGYIVTDGRSSATNVEGVFAAGDVQDPRYRQAVNAAASGCRAALDAEKFLKQ